VEAAKVQPTAIVEGQEDVNLIEPRDVGVRDEPRDENSGVEEFDDEEFEGEEFENKKLQD
jgi:hypothetical protein